MAGKDPKSVESEAGETPWPELQTAADVKRVLVATADRHVFLDEHVALESRDPNTRKPWGRASIDTIFTAN